MNFLTFKNQVKQDASGREITDGSFAQVVSDYVMAKSLLHRGDGRGHASFLSDFWKGRDSLLGYTYSGTDADLVSDVQSLLSHTDASDDSATHALAAKAISLYVKAQIVREVDGDLELFGSLMTDWQRAKTDLWGVTYEIAGAFNTTTLGTEVGENITVDSSRVGIEALKTNAINEALAELDAMKSLVTNHVLDAKREVIGQGSFVDSQIKAAVRDVQKYVEFYRKGVVTYFSSGGTVPGTGILLHDNHAVTGEMPDGARIKEAWILAVDLVDNNVSTSLVDSVLERYPLRDFGWEGRMHLAKGNPQAGNYIAIDPRSKKFYAYPAVGGRDLIEIVYDSVTGEYSDTDEVPFDEDMVQAVAEYVRAKLATRRPDLEARSGAQTSAYHMALFKEMRGRLYLDNKERTAVRDIPPGLVKECEYVCTLTTNSTTTDTIVTT